MHSRQTIQSCIQHCQATASDIKAMSADATGPVKQTLDQAYQSIDSCIKQCQSALNQL